MTTLAHRRADGGPRDGGVAARRALVRWAGRMFRREWRQQLLVLTLLTVAVAAAIGSITVAYNAVPADDGEFGSANHLLNFDGSDPRKLEAGLDVRQASFGAIDVIGHRSVRVPGAVETIDYRTQDPDGAYSGDLLALRRGSYPVGRSQVAVTDGVAESLRLEIGSTLALDGHRRTVVGIVENPSKLTTSSRSSPPRPRAPDRVTVLVDATAASLDSFYRTLDEGDRSRSAFAGSWSAEATSAERQRHWRCSPWPRSSCSWPRLLPPQALRSSHSDGSASSACSPRSARRRSRYASCCWNGAAVGTIAAVIGTIVGLALWVVFAPTLESAVDHRIDRLSLPWGLLAAAVLLAVLGATVAAWWPGRTVARVPVVVALSGRPPRPRPARHSASRPQR